MKEEGFLKLRTKLCWISALYFAEGFPFGVIRDVIPVFFREHGVSLTGVGSTAFLGLPWSLKFLWSPLVDRYGERRYWITACLLIMAALMMVTRTFDPTTLTFGLWMVLLAFTIASATQDVAIDAYTIGFVERGEEGQANGVRVAAYRIALLVSGGGMLVLASGKRWNVPFIFSTVIFLMLAIGAWYSPKVIIPGEKRRQWLVPMRKWLNQPGAWAVFLFIMLYKLGDNSIGIMVKPFWLDHGLSAGEVGTVSVSAGVGATILGALLGGYLTSRWGIFHGLWILGIAQALSNLGYVAIAWLNPSAPSMTFSYSSISSFIASAGEPTRLMIYSASIVESFTQGLGTAAFLSFLMRICQKENAATQYALLSALFAISRDLVGGVSGVLTENMGYASYFILTFFLAFPAYLLLPWIHPWIRKTSQS